MDQTAQGADDDPGRVRDPAVHVYSWQGERFRVAVAGDVVALPDEHWSAGGFGDGISEHWLLAGGDGGPAWWFPGKTRSRKRLLAYLVRRALADHHGYELPASAWSGDGEPPRRSR